MDRDQMLLDVPPVARELAELVTQERKAREQAEKTANDLARLVAAEMRRADEERDARLEAEKVAQGMAALVAHEHARAEEAGDLLRGFGYRI